MEYYGTYTRKLVYPCFAIQRVARLMTAFGHDEEKGANLVLRAFQGTSLPWGNAFSEGKAYGSTGGVLPSLSPSPWSRKLKYPSQETKKTKTTTISNRRYRTRIGTKENDTTLYICMEAHFRLTVNLKWIIFFLVPGNTFPALDEMGHLDPIPSVNYYQVKERRSVRRHLLRLDLQARA